jgi:metallo-beta-lactamase family protein
MLLVGFQAAGSRGRLLRDGAAEIKIHGRYFPVKAEIRELTGLSAHADQRETLGWLEGFTGAPSRVFLVHGEPQAADSLRRKITDTFHWNVTIPKPLEKFGLE